MKSAVDWDWTSNCSRSAASVYWIRFDLALRDGEYERAYVLAERALILEPSAPAGWHTLARHLIFDRASFESEQYHFGKTDKRSPWTVRCLPSIYPNETSGPGM